MSFINRVPFWGFAVLNADDPGIRTIMPRVVPRTITVGFEAGAEIRATAPVVDQLRQNFMVTRQHRNLGRLQLRLPGRFNVLNALTATAVALELGVPFATVQKALAAFSGVRRRFEYKGVFHGATVVDDYGHHPTEVAATLTAARGLNPPRLVVAFQPHLFSRTQRLYKEFAQALMLADEVYVADIYPARERPEPGVTSQLIVDQLVREGHRVAGGPLPLGALLVKLKKELKPGDLLLTMGAGDIWKLGEDLIKSEKSKVRAKSRMVPKGKKA